MPVDTFWGSLCDKSELPEALMELLTSCPKVIPMMTLLIMATRRGL